jgi:hypothetical protein
MKEIAKALVAGVVGFGLGCVLIHLSGQSTAVARPSIDMVQYTAPRAPAFLPAEMRTLRGARSYEMDSALVKTAPAVSLVKNAVIADMAEVGVNILDRDAQLFTAPYSPTVSKPIKEAEVLSAQKKWGEGIVEIGKLAGSPAEATAKAESVISTLYGYKTGPVLFKPTKAAEKPFRLDPAAALSYFVSGNTAFPEDKGFALKPWTGVRFENNGVLLEGTTALAQGNYFFTDTDGKETKVEYTFGYFRDSAGQLRINLHHSSLPFKPA